MDRTNIAEQKTKALARAQDLLRYIDASPTPYHAVFETARRLMAAGFLPLDEREVWALEPGQRRFVTRNGSSLIAFIAGQKSPAVGGFRIVGAHTDSPTLKLKPKAAYTKHGYRQVGVEVYGGVLYSTWLDRDLSVAGRLSVRGPSGVESVLVDLEVPALRVPNLAIHLFREVNSEGLKLNAQTHLPPIWGLEGTENPETELMKRLADRAGVAASDVLDHDLSLYDTQKGAITGVDRSFLQVARIDNLASCHAAISALTEAPASAETTRVAALFDHEEVGSRTAVGAQSTFLRATLERILEAHPDRAAQAFFRAMAASFLVSADMAHAVHPNYADRHEPNHQPMLGKGPVLKSNANQSYATTGESAAMFVAYCKEAGFQPQNFVVRTDLGCGSTIGPITAALLGVKTVDVGNPMLSMHSCREMAAVQDVELMHGALLQHFL
ncbi:MAG: M18 family aminopeptidase [Myxococcota bacterium]